MYRPIGKLLIVASMATGLLCAARAPAQPSSHQAKLEESRLTSKGSKPYQETVAAFLEGKAPKIVGGTTAAVGAYPWQVSLGVSWIANPYDAHFCGGSVYSASWIITAAHCVKDSQPEDVSIVAGTNVLRPGSVRHNVQRIIVHKDYDPATSDNDIALLQLFKPLTLDAKTRAIPLLDKAAEAAVLIEDAALEVTGWGATTEGGDPVKDLRFVRIPFVPRDTCNRPLAYDGRVSNNMICAGLLAGGHDSCQGDSGGALSVVSARPVLAGVVSWGDGCARPNKVGVYTRVPQYVDWIGECTVRPDSCNQ